MPKGIYIILSHVGFLLWYVIMIGTSNEVLLWLTRHSEWAELLGMSRQRLVGLRKHIADGGISEERKEEILTRMNIRVEQIRNGTMYGQSNISLPSVVRCVRKRYVLPAVVRDKHGKFFSEVTLVRMVEREEKMCGLNLDMVCRAIKRGDLPSREVVREVLNRKGWTMFEPRQVLPSVWEVE